MASTSVHVFVVTDAEKKGTNATKKTKIRRIRDHPYDDRTRINRRKVNFTYHGFMSLRTNALRNIGAERQEEPSEDEKKKLDGRDSRRRVERHAATEKPLRKINHEACSRTSEVTRALVIRFFNAADESKSLPCCSLLVVIHVVCRGVLFPGDTARNAAVASKG